MESSSGFCLDARKGIQNMRVLHIVSNISLRSGIMSFIMNYGRHLAEDVKFEFLYYEDREYDHKAEIVALGGAAYKSPSPTSFRSFQAYLNEFCKQHQSEYDIIHLHDPFLVLFYAPLKKKLLSKSFVVHAHSTRFADSMVGGVRNRIFSIPNLWVPDYLFACSKLAGKKIFGRRFTEEGVVINNAILVNRFRNTPTAREKARNELGVGNKFVIGHIGNFTLPKNHQFIIDVFFQITRMRSDAVLILVGDGELRTQIEAKCTELGIEQKIHFLGVRYDVNEVMCAFDRFIFPSLYEGLGIALIEAQAAGIPSIYSSAVPTETNILKKNNRILDLNQSADEWANAVMDDKLSVTFGVEQEIENAGFDINIEACRLKELYQSMRVKNNEKI